MEVSLYIPCYNAAQTIAFCLEGVLRQSYPVREILVIDDGSTDQTEEVLSAYKLRVIRHGSNLGIAGARNTALRYAQSEYIASLDADCVPEPEWLANLMRRFSDQRLAGAGGMLRERYTLSGVDLWRSVYMRQHWGDLKVSPRFLFGSNTVFRRRALQEAGGYDERYRTNYEDCDMSLRLRERGYELIYDPEAVVHHLRRDTLRSLLRTHWRWSLRGYSGVDREPKNPYNLLCKTFDNFCYLLGMLAQDLRSGRIKLLPIDLLFFPDHCIRDCRYLLRAAAGRGER